MLLYYIQNKLRSELQDHKSNLEKIVRDRTDDLNSIIEELKNTQSQLIHSEKMASLATLTDGVAHEINNPLNYINGGLMIINDIKKEYCISENEKFHTGWNKATEMISKGLEKAVRIVKAINSFTYVESTKSVKTDLAKMIDDILLLLAHKLKGISLIKEYYIKEKVAVFPDKMYQVILNILENAIYEIRLADQNKNLLQINADDTGTILIIKIFNTGEKIPKENLKRIFDPFFTTKDPGLGVGLGLSICYTLIKEHKGNIYAENTTDGVTFTIEIPKSI